MKNILFAGIDVDDKAFHVTVINSKTKASTSFSCKPNVTSLAEKFVKFNMTKKQLKLCYEATYLGFSLYRSLTNHGYQCEVISPSLIPEVPGFKKKTDRIDSYLLAKFYMNDLLCPVHVPDLDQEMDRDLLRSRKFLVNRTSALKNHILSMCRRQGWNYREETKMKSYWTKEHFTWMDRKVSKEKNTSIRVNMHILLQQLQSKFEQIESYDAEIEHLAEQDRYKNSVKTLSCFRGFDITSSLGFILEIGDIRRFDHPRRLTSYVGLDLIEASSGGRENKFGISKDGNKHLRTILIEASQFALRPPRVSAHKRRLRRDASKTAIAVADRCMNRLYKKATRMLYKGKHHNKIKTACAREMLGFIWESLMQAA